MRIGIDARPMISKYPSGIGVYLQSILAQIHATDDNHEYYLYSNVEMEGKIPDDHRFQIRIVPGRIGTLWLRYQIPREVRNDHLDVFWGTQHILPKRVKGVRQVLTVHDLALLINPKWGSTVNAIMQNVFLRASVRDADFIFADSKSTEQDLKRICRVVPDRIRTIYLGGTKDDGFCQDDEDGKAAQKGNEVSPYFCYVGTIEPRKNLETIVRAFEILASEEADLHLILAGGLGWKYKGILSLVQNSAYKDRIFMPGYVSAKEKYHLYSDALAFLFPSHYEGFGIPVLEAMTVGCPVITDRISSLGEVAGDAALYVEDENDPELLADKMRIIMNMSSDERMRMIEAGKVQAGNFTWENCSKETLQAILDCGM